jgi:glutathione S-transferase
MKPRLVSFKLCPFVQRAVIALEYKNVDYDITYIDLADPPDWFKELSPLHRVPILLVDDHVIFESTVINEYIDEAYANRLHPEDLILRAHDRSWIEFGNACMWHLLDLSVKETEADFDATRGELEDKFDHLETAIVGEPFFNGEKFSLVDASYAPLFQRLAYLDELRPGLLDRARHPGINAWADHLATLDAVRRSTVPEIKSLYLKMLAKRQGFISAFLDRAESGKPAERSVY